MADPKERFRQAIWFVSARVLLLVTVAAITLAACGEREHRGDATVSTVSSTAEVNEVSAFVPAQTTSSAEAQGVSPSPTTDDDQSGLSDVIVNLDVAWSPDDGSSETEIAAIAQAQRDVLALLTGTRFRVIWLYKVTPQMALRVDDDAMERLEESGLVTSVSPNTLDPAGG